MKTSTLARTKSDAFGTASGRTCYVLAPERSAICIDDVADGLARTPRFNGHTSRPYSVAAHSLLVASLLPPDLQLAGLLHDASEAYLGDLISPVKHLPQIRAVWQPIEDAWQREIEIRLGGGAHPLVQAADSLAIELERHDNLPRGDLWYVWGRLDRPVCASEYGLPPRDLTRLHIDTWSGPELVRERFLRRFKELR
jgi:hypothetical protein